MASRRNGGTGGMSKQRRGLQECFVNPNSKCIYIFPGSYTGINCINTPVFTEYLRASIYSSLYSRSITVFTVYPR